MFTFTFATPAQGVDSTFLSPEARYRNAVEQIAKSGLLGRNDVALETFSTMDWVEKTALINLACPVERERPAAASCRSILSSGVEDQALVVRDHAMKKMLAAPFYSTSFKQSVAKKILADPRNYRRGKPLWIVHGAKQYLAGR